MIYFEFYNLILYLKKKIKSNLNISSIILIKSSQMFFGYVYGQYAFDLLNIFILNGACTLTSFESTIIESRVYTVYVMH